MKSRWIPTLVLAALAGLLPMPDTTAQDTPPAGDGRAKARKLQADGNFKEALELYREVLAQPASGGAEGATDVQQVVVCLNQLGLQAEFDATMEAIASAQGEDWRVLRAVANAYANVDHHGFRVAGAFTRGFQRGGNGENVTAEERDRVRALQLMQQALAQTGEEEDNKALAQAYYDYARIVMGQRGYADAWQLQDLTNLDELPDYEPGWGYQGRDVGTPVDADGNPLFYEVPAAWAEAKNDGERWRWLLAEAMELDPATAAATTYEHVRFLRAQYGEETLMRGYYSGWFGRQSPEGDGKENESGTFELHTLKESETICRLATGVKRVTLPDEHNPIVWLRRLAEDPTFKGHEEYALNDLAQIFENRRQYPKAAEFWKTSIEKFGAGNEKWKTKRLHQIVRNWGRFDGTSTHPAGAKATVGYLFRNGSKVALEARAIDARQLLADLKEYLKSNPAEVEGERIQVGDIGYALVNANYRKYVKEKVAAWEQEVEPRPNHWDRRIDVTTPLDKPGAYLLEAKMDDGNTEHIIIWIEDTAVVKKPLVGKTYLFVADAVSGNPVAGVEVAIFGYKTEWLDQKKFLSKRRFNIHTKDFSVKADAEGQVIQDAASMPNDYQWLITATDANGRFAYHGFTGVWYPNYHDAEYKETKFFTITDRPVYRPGQEVEFKTWIAHAQYDKKDGSDFAKKKFVVEIHNPKGEKVFEETLETDDFGGLAGKLALKDDATLGVYSILTRTPDRTLGGTGSFRIEEYKKPEYEVTIEAPKEPVMLGETIPATIKAKYYFGAPVQNATVTYKVLRTDHNARWFAPMPWDWFYGSGYWWFASDYGWYPGWERWGCRAPRWSWWPMVNTPPEVVLENEVPIGEDGTVEVKIDTALAKVIHGDIDHQYEITAEVRDASRRTIVGKGNVLVARQPFKVHVWVDRGHYRVGDVIQADINARTLDGKAVEGQGKLTLFKIAYDADGQPLETEAASWALNPDAEGRARQQIKASAAGQYRLSYVLTDQQDHRIEGGYVFVVRGDGFDGKEFRFNEIEIVTDKREYAPGETVRVMINTDRVGGTVALFVRPSNGVYLAPKIIRLQGKSVVEEIAVVQKDMPNFFLEAFTISGGKLHEQMREVVVPPEKRVLNVEVLPDEPEYKPGAHAKVKVRLTDFDGEPFVGSTVVTVYDKALEYISGGSNVPEIRAFFWKWRRSHNIHTENSLAKWFQSVGIKNKDGMGSIGMFGEGVADLSLLEGAAFGGGGRPQGRGGADRKLATRAFSAPPGANPITAGLRSGSAAVESDNIDGLLNEVAADFAAGTGGAAPVDPGGEAAAPEVTPTIRENFADLAFWAGALTTDKDGVTEIELDMPENLTTWKIRTWAMGGGTNVGQGEAEVITSKDLLIRMQAPRFFVQTDEVVLSANVHNYLESAKDVRVVLELGGKTLAPLDGVALEQKVRIEAKGEERIDWRVRVLEEGEAEITMKALTDEESDAMRMKYPVFVHGMLKTDSFSGAIRPEDENGSLTFTVPAERKPEQSRLEVRYSPTVAMAMVDALPFLASFPYGCTEQTLNRFLPTVITQKVLQGMGVNLADVKEKRTNLNPQEIGDDRERARQWQRWNENPVFDDQKVEEMVREGVARLAAMQNQDGGWGWFSGWEERSWPHTTATVVHGLQLAKANDVELPQGILERGVARLKQFQDESVEALKNWPDEKKDSRKEFADNLDAFVFMVLCDADVVDADMRDFVYRDRNHLAVYGKALAGLAMHKLQRVEERDMLVRNIEQFLKVDDENQTAYLELGNAGYWWHWYGSEFEAQATYLKLLAAVKPESPQASGLVKYLVNNRKHATYWNSTRDTALCVEAIADFIRASGEDAPDMTVEILLDGKPVKEVAITKENLFTYDNQLVLAGDALANGEHTLEFRKSGTGPLYFNAYLTNFTLENFITKAGLEIKVERQFYKLVPEDKEVRVVGSKGQAVGQKVEKFARVPLKSGDSLKSGDLVEIELVIESKNDYEYIVFEDMKASGFEPVEVRSGYARNGLGAYMELRDEKVAFFVRALARGKHSLAYRMRAEIPGAFSALPTSASAMYAPELKANSDEMKVSIED